MNELYENYENNGVPAVPEPRSEWYVRLGRWLVSAWRPYLGWLAFLLCMALSTAAGAAAAREQLADFDRLGGAPAHGRATGSCGSLAS